MIMDKELMGNNYITRIQNVKNYKNSKAYMSILLRIQVIKIWVREVTGNFKNERVICKEIIC